VTNCIIGRRMGPTLAARAVSRLFLCHSFRSEAEAIVKALAEAGLALVARIHGMDACTTTQFAQSFGSATAAKPITRQTADHAPSQLFGRVNQVNRGECFLAKVTKVVVLGS
jgi:hypothetical protein